MKAMLLIKVCTSGETGQINFTWKLFKEGVNYYIHSAKTKGAIEVRHLDHM